MHVRPLRVLILALFLYEVKGHEKKNLKKFENDRSYPEFIVIFSKMSVEVSRSESRPTKTRKKTREMVKRSKTLRLSWAKIHHTLKMPPKRRQSGTPSAYVFLRLINVLKKVRCVLFCMKRIFIKAVPIYVSTPWLPDKRRKTGHFSLQPLWLFVSLREPLKAVSVTSWFPDQRAEAGRQVSELWLSLRRRFPD